MGAHIPWATSYRFSGASAGELVYPIEHVEWAVRSVDFGFILQNVELCHFKRIVPKNVLQVLVVVRKPLEGQRQIDIAREERVSRQHVQQVKKLAKDAGFSL